MAFDPVPPYSELNVFIGDTSVVVQPASKARSSAQVDTLSADLRTGSVQTLASAVQRGPAIPIVAVMGISPLFKGGLLVACVRL